MANEYIAPIDHSAGSAVASVGIGTGVGVIKSGVKTGVSWIGITALLGAGLLAWPAFALIGGTAGILAAVGAGIAGAIGGGFLGVLSTPLVASIGAIFGGFKGGERAAQQVNMERGAASQLQAQVDIAKTQIMAQSAQPTYVMAPSNDNKYQFPAQGTPMNMANPRGLQADGIQYDGRMAGQQLAASL